MKKNLNQIVLWVEDIVTSPLLTPPLYWSRSSAYKHVCDLLQLKWSLSVLNLLFLYLSIWFVNKTRGNPNPPTSYSIKWALDKKPFVKVSVRKGHSCWEENFSTVKSGICSFQKRQKNPFKIIPGKWSLSKPNSLSLSLSLITRGECASLLFIILSTITLF